MSAFTYTLTDGWEKTDPRDSFLCKLVEEHFPNARWEEKNPDICIYFPFGARHLSYLHSTKIQYTLENDWPDFNFADYSIGFYHLEWEDRYLRFPWYTQVPGYEALREASLQGGVSHDFSRDDAAALDRKFCNFIYSNSKALPLRDRFFKRLSEYKPVDSGGRHLNNIGHRVQNKMKWLQEYKFTIAIENSATSGYTTEKLTEPLVAGSIPIYHGNPTVDRDFNTHSMVWIRDEADVERAVEQIVALDQDDRAYLQMLRTPAKTLEQARIDYHQKLVDFFRHIVEQPAHQRIRRPINPHSINSQLWARRRRDLSKMWGPLYPVMRRILKWQGRWL